MSCDRCGELTRDLMFDCSCGKMYCAVCGYESCGEYDHIKETYENCWFCVTNNEYIDPPLMYVNRDIFTSLGRWSRFFQNVKITEIVNIISNVLRGKRETKRVKIYPRCIDVFNAFRLCRLESVRVVIVGQDCYHSNGQAMGLSFSVRSGITPPPSLVNIYKELENDGFTIKNKSNGDLTVWARRGVFLYNMALTVEESTPLSHVGLWKHFSQCVISHLLSETKGLVFILWGAEAQSLTNKIKSSQGDHHIISSPHPSPLSAYRGFFGSRPFSRANAFLHPRSIDWNLDDTSTSI